MGIRFCVLGSGSGGNATLLLTPRTHLLIDAGFAAAELAARLAVAGLDWPRLHAVLLTHTHGDHLKSSVLGVLARHHIPVYCHEEHAAECRATRHGRTLAELGLWRTFTDGGALRLGPDLTAWPLALPHDRPPTFGYRFEARTSAGALRRIAYVADCGHEPRGLAGQIGPVDLLALEFNHDEELERASGRPDFLIARVLGPQGHLSNCQAARLLERLIALAPDGGPELLVQLHLSEDCNRPKLAYQAAVETIARWGARTRIVTSRQDQPGYMHVLK